MPELHYWISAARGIRAFNGSAELSVSPAGNLDRLAAIGRTSWRNVAPVLSFAGLELLFWVADPSQETILMRRVVELDRFYAVGDAGNESPDPEPPIAAGRRLHAKAFA